MSILERDTSATLPEGKDAAVPTPTVPRPRGPVDRRVFQLMPALRRDALLLGALAALGAVGLLGQLLAAAWAVTAVAEHDSPWPPVIAFTSVTLVRSLLRGLEQTRTAEAAGRARVGFAVALVTAALRMSPDRLAGTGPGPVSALATNGVDTLEKYVTRYLPAVVPAVLLPPVVIVLLAVLDPRSAVIVVLTLPLIPLFAALVGRLTERRSAEQWQLMSRLASHFLDVVQGLVTLRAYRRAGRQVEVLTDVGERHRAATVRVLRIAFLSGTALDLIATLSVGLVAVEAGLRVAAGHLGLGTALVCILIAPEAYRPVRELGARFHESADASTILDEATVLLEAAPPAVAAQREGSLPSGVAILADGLTVRVPGRQDPVLSGVGLWVFQGQITAIVGPSGVGKTTLVRVLAGQQPVVAGFVEVEAPIAYLPQRPTFPLARNLREAVTAAWPDAPQRVIEEAVRDAAISDFVAGLPAGLDTSLAEDGRDLSAGQRQRIALARTYVYAARLVEGQEKAYPAMILDEPTAHLDDATERAVLAGLRRRADAGGAVVMVAHRPAAIAAADEVTHLAPRYAEQADLRGQDRPEKELLENDRAAIDQALIELAAFSEQTATTKAGPAPVQTSQNHSVVPGFGQSWSDAKSTRSWIPARLRKPTMNLAVILGTLSSLSGVALTAVAAWLLTKASSQPPILTLTIAVVGVRLFAVARPLLGYLDRLVAHDVALADLGRLRARVFADLIPRVPGPALPRRGDLLTRLVDDVDAVGETRLRWRRPAIVAGGTLVVSVVVGALIDPFAALAALPGLLLASVAAPALAGSGADRRATEAAEAKAGYAQTVVEVLAGAEDVNALGRTGAGIDPVRAAGIRAVAKARAQVRRNAGAEFLRMAGAGLAVAGVMLVATQTAHLSLEQVGVLVLGTLALADVTASLPDAVNARTRGRIAQQRLGEVLRTAPPSVDAGAITDLSVAGAQPAVALTDVTAGWNRAQPVLHEVRLDLRPGCRIAVQGPSGSGKSTLAAVVLKFLDPHRGTAELGGHDYRDLTGDRIRESVGLVSDDDHVFASTVRENLRLAKPDAKDSELRVALTRARLGNWFNATPAGLDTWLGERGATMSAGERRRLALARALLADRPLLVLDEPAESLDAETAEAVLEDILAESAGRSVLLVTHRREGLSRVDQVLRLEAGRMVRART
jgi:ATP-binding cassette subfamily C protein CydCD